MTNFLTLRNCHSIDDPIEGIVVKKSLPFSTNRAHLSTSVVNHFFNASHSLPRLPVTFVFVCVFSLGLSSVVFADVRSYKTDSFTFEIPEPWQYAIPSNDQKNVARCFLKSKLRLTAKGRFIVDTGRPAQEMPQLLDGMASRMVPKGSKAKVKREKVKLGGVGATLLTSETRNYYLPCGVVVCMRGERIYMAMLSVAETEDLDHRDTMIKSLLTTWKWHDD